MCAAMTEGWIFRKRRHWDAGRRECGYLSSGEMPTSVLLDRKENEENRA